VGCGCGYKRGQHGSMGALVMFAALTPDDWLSVFYAGLFCVAVGLCAWLYFDPVDLGEDG